MKKAFCLILIAFTAVGAIPKTASASEPNNKVGIHIIDETDLPDAAALVNSNGGQWGYVTVVIREDERDSSRWQRAMDEMRRLKLIPIVRIASKMTNSHWEVPKEEEAVNWAGFLNSLNWPVKNRYIILFNEPNHAKEWGGIIDPAEYARIASHYLYTLKNFSADFFVLPAALDLAAPNSSVTMEASTFYQRMHEQDNYIFTIFDGLNSHSYPNPGFMGEATDTGKTSIKGYKWELSYLSNLGLSPEIPVFITETGWINEAGEDYKVAFKDVWSDPQVKAVTPFVLNYKSEPFDSFSWKDPLTGAPREQYISVQSITKVKGEPSQLHSFEFMDHNIAEYLISDSEYLFFVNLKNTGQSIWQDEDGFKLISESTMKNENLLIGPVPATEPGQIAKIPIRLNTSEPRGIHSIKFKFFKGENLLGEFLSTKFTLVSPPSLDLLAKFWFGTPIDNRASLELYDKEDFVARFDNLSFVDGKATIPALKNVVPNRAYRFRLTKEFFAPVEKTMSIYVGNIDINFGRLIPIDLNNDGEINLKDIAAYFVNPLVLPLLIWNL